MAKIDTTGLTPMQVNRLDFTLSKLHRNDDGTISNLRTIIERDFPDHPDKEIIDGLVDFNPSTFNRLAPKKARAYKAQLEAKRIYVLKSNLNFGMRVSKAVFDAVPGRIIRNVDETHEYTHQSATEIPA